MKSWQKEEEEEEEGRIRKANIALNHLLFHPSFFLISFFFSWRAYHNLKNYHLGGDDVDYYLVWFILQANPPSSSFPLPASIFIIITAITTSIVNSLAHTFTKPTLFTFYFNLIFNSFKPNLNNHYFYCTHTQQYLSQS